jgi:cytochrome c-type biogenesis protein
MVGDDVTIGLAFVAGLISFISPCVLPLVPAYIGYMGGRMTKQVAQQTAAVQQPSVRQRFGTLTHGLFFVLGFTLFFVLFGLLTTAAVSSLTSLGVTESDVRDGITRIGGTVVILFGLHVMGALNRLFAWLQKRAAWLDQNPYGNLISALIGMMLIGVMYWLLVESWFLTLMVVLIVSQLFRDALKADTPGEFWSRMITRIQTVLYVDTRRQSQVQSQYGYLGSMFMGIVFSAGWTPCIGPIYGAVLTLASTGDSISKAGVLLTAYSLGLGIPFLLTALALDQAQGVFRRLQRNMRVIEVVSGAFLILVGVLVFSGQLERLTQQGARGSLADVSFNLENCIVGAVEGRVLWENVLDCIGDDGVKADFYLAASKANRASAPVIVPELTTTSAASGAQALNVPNLDAPGFVATGPDSESEPGDGGPDVTGVSVPEGLKVGQRAPDFTAQTLNGQTVSLSSYQGQVVLLNFWATWCGPCREEMPDFQAIYDVHGADGFAVLAVNNTPTERHLDDVSGFVDELSLTFPIVLDESGAINDNIYRDVISGYPTSLLIDADGVIVQHFPGLVQGGELLEALDGLLGE